MYPVPRSVPPAGAAVALAAAVASLVAPGRASGQPAREAPAPRVSVDASVGMTPTLYRQELYVGPSFGVGVVAPVAPRLAVRADARVTAVGSFLEFRTETYTLGVESPLVRTRGRVPVGLRASVGAGATRARIDTVHVDLRLRLRASRAAAAPAGAPASPAVGRGAAHVASWHPAAGGALHLTADVARRVGLFLEAAAALTPVGGDGGTIVQLPAAAGVRVRF